MNKQRESLYVPLWHVSVSKVVVGFALLIRSVSVSPMTRPMGVCWILELAQVFQVFR
jgi:hypothetical protein